MRVKGLTAEENDRHLLLIMSGPRNVGQIFGQVFGQVFDQVFGKGWKNTVLSLEDSKPNSRDY